MRKRWIGLMIVLAGLGLQTACGGKTYTGTLTNKSVGKVEPKVTVTFKQQSDTDATMVFAGSDSQLSNCEYPIKLKRIQLDGKWLRWDPDACTLHDKLGVDQSITLSGGFDIEGSKMSGSFDANMTGGTANYVFEGSEK